MGKGEANERPVSASGLFTRLKEKGSIAAFAKQIGEQTATLTNWRTRGIPRAKVGPVANALGMSYEDYMAEAGVPLHRTAKRGVVKLTGVIIIDRLEVRASMGPGTELPEHDHVIDRITVTQQFIQLRLPRITSPSNLRVISAYGDSMAPTFNDGDLMIVDIGVRHIDVDGVFALSSNKRLYIKRVRQKLDGKFVVSSDNPAVGTPEELSGKQTVDILGRVVWAWNGKRL